MTDTNTSSEETAIMMEDLDPNFKFEVAEEHGGENIKRCFACGTCSSICPVFGVNEKYNPRKIIRMIVLGLREEVLKNEFIWLCSQCYSCYERCPRDVKITTVMAAVRNIAVRNGYIPTGMKAAVDLIDKFGRILEVSEFENTVRGKKGMPLLELIIPELKDVLEKEGIHDIIKGKGSGSDE